MHSTMMQAQLAGVEEAAADLRAGRMVVVCDGDGCGAQLVIAAEFADADAVNFMAREARGLVCLAMTPERCDRLGLDLMSGRAGESQETKAFTVSIEARDGVTTGISAGDRARTIAVAIDPDSEPEDLVAPGHVFPLRARARGLLERAGEAEAAVDLVRAAELNPAAAVCEIIDDSGGPMLMPDLGLYCERHGLRLVSIPQLVEHRLNRG